MVEDPKFPERALAASVASKVFYYLEEFDEALRLALESGDLFDLNEKSKYVETLINKCIDRYIKLRQEIVDSKTTNPPTIDQKMELIIDKMFTRCFQDKMFKQAIGVALESRRLDKVQTAIESSGEQIEENLSYTFSIAQDIVKSKVFRNDVLRLLLLIYQKRNDQGKFDYYQIAQCQFFLGLPEGTASLLEKLVKSDGSSFLDAYQIAFDICDKENQSFQRSVQDIISQKIEALDAADLSVKDTRERLTQITNILKGDIRDRLYQQFLKKNNHMDMALIQNMKKSIGQKSSILHGASIWSYGMMNAFTTNDSFMKDNMQWVGQVTNWNRFNATASLGVIHSGNKREALEILNPYFTGAPLPDQQNSPYTTAGAYFAYGLIHQNQYSQELVNYFLDGYRNSG